MKTKTGTITPIDSLALRIFRDAQEGKLTIINRAELQPKNGWAELGTALKAHMTNRYGFVLLCQMGKQTDYRNNAHLPTSKVTPSRSFPTATTDSKIAAQLGKPRPRLERSRRNALAKRVGMTLPKPPAQSD